MLHETFRSLAAGLALRHPVLMPDILWRSKNRPLGVPKEIDGSEIENTEKEMNYQSKETGYFFKTASVEIRSRFSIILWAMSSLSKGSLCISGNSWT